LAGIACTFEEIGMQEEAESAMRLAYKSHLLFGEASMLLGVAGWGVASLYFYLRTKAQFYLNWSIRAGEYLLSIAERDGQYFYWRRKEDQIVHYGFGHGAAGIALLLAHLHLLTGRADFRNAAIGALEFDLQKKVEDELGWGWHRFEGDKLVSPYWIHGASGIGSVAIRIYRLLGVEHHYAAACRIADDAFIKYTVFPGLFNGLAGIGEFMLDMHDATGNKVYEDRAFDIADTILLFEIDHLNGGAWPGDGLSRISNDYSSGAAGIGLFFTRLLHSTRRFLMDFPEERASGVPS
jgi:lantibiotic modifying enzyme